MQIISISNKALRVGIYVKIVFVLCKGIKSKT